MKSTRLRRLLVVDDDSSMRECFVVCLGDEYEIIGAASGREAIRDVQLETFPVVILDLMMEGMSGIETLKRLKKICAFQKIIILTGHSCKESAISSLNMGAFYYVTKPFHPAVLKSVIKKGFKLYEQEASAFAHQIATPEELSPLGLSRRESEIAFWARTGESNREIGERLGLSHRTVGKHMEAIFKKLGITSRAKLFHRTPE